jgi:hypothetical protein
VTGVVAVDEVDVISYLIKEFNDAILMKILSKEVLFSRKG